MAIVQAKSQRWRLLAAHLFLLCLCAAVVFPFLVVLSVSLRPGKPGLADALFGAAGFQEIATTTLDAPFHMPTARHYLDFVRASASPIQQILSRLSPQAANDAWADMEERLSTFATPNGWVEVGVGFARTLPAK